MKNIKVIQIYMPEDCRYGLCDCEGAENCKFPRCKNCDEILDENGKWIDDNDFHGTEPDHCPDCGAPL